MGKFYAEITEKQAALIKQSPLFFVASVHPELTVGPEGEGPVNVSPKGGVPLHVIDPRTVAYLDFPGSGDETGRHARDDGPVTVLALATGPGRCGRAKDGGDEEADDGADVAACGRRTGTRPRSPLQRERRDRR